MQNAHCQAELKVLAARAAEAKQASETAQAELATLQGNASRGAQTIFCVFITAGFSYFTRIRHPRCAYLPTQQAITDIHRRRQRTIETRLEPRPRLKA